MQRYFSFIALGFIVLGLIAATVIEKLIDREAAVEAFYLSHWMIALWTVTAASGLATVIARRRGLTVASFCLHISLILILAGAAVTHFFGQQGHITLQPFTPTTSFTLSDGSTTPLPFSLKLKEYGSDYHPGTVSARDYYSLIEVTDGEKVLTERVSMNRALDLHGYRFCQSALGADYSTLTVNHDPYGIGISFGAYGLLFVSMAMILIHPGGQFRRLLRRLLTTAIMLLAIPQAGADEHDDSSPEVLQRPLAKNFGRLYIYTGGRIQPMQTFARDFCLKVYGKDSYQDFTPEQVLTGWLFYYDDWKRLPFIRLKSRRAREAMGGRSYVSLSELYAGGEYKIDKLLNADPSPDRDLIADDEKVSLVTSVCTGNAFKIFPIPGDNGATSWHSWVERLPAHTDIGIQEEISSTISSIYKDINHGQFRAANHTITNLRNRQEQMAAGSLPSPAAISAERLYNNTFYPLLSAITTLLAGIAALVIYLYGLRHLRPAALAVAWVSFLYASYLIILRWIIGGHIPLATGYETMLAMAWISLALSLWTSRRIAIILPLGMIVAGAALLVSMMGSRNPSVGPLIPVLASRLLSLHVMLVMTSYSLFAIIALIGAIGLSSRQRRERMTLIAETLLYPSLFLLGAGIFVGAIWANQSWGRYWGWDPKETWALITFFIYALPMHRGTFSWFRSPRNTLLYLLIAFSSVLMTYLGVNYLLTGLHSYGA